VSRMNIYDMYSRHVKPSSRRGTSFVAPVHDVAGLQLRQQAYFKLRNLLDHRQPCLLDDPGWRRNHPLLPPVRCCRARARQHRLDETSANHVQETGTRLIQWTQVYVAAPCTMNRPLCRL
jgi:hypothetical protein